MFMFLYIFADDKIIDFCAMYMRTEGESVYLQYNPSGNRHKKRDCHCSASTSSGGLEIHAIDIRFPMDFTGICGINQKSYLQFDSENQTIKCHDKQLIGGYTNIYNTSNQNVDIRFHLDGEPQSVWIGITGNYILCYHLQSHLKCIALILNNII